jgi:hypothetical protein
MSARDDYPELYRITRGIGVEIIEDAEAQADKALDEIDRLNDNIQKLLTELSNYSMGGRSVWLCPNGCNAAYAIRCSVCNTLVKDML